MILQKLVAYYDRLAADPDSGIAPFGFAPQNISFCIVLERDGRLSDVLDIRPEDERGRPRPVQLPVPHFGSKRTSAIRPNFLATETDRRCLVELPLGQDGLRTRARRGRRGQDD